MDAIISDHNIINGFKRSIRNKSIKTQFRSTTGQASCSAGWSGGVQVINDSINFMIWRFCQIGMISILKNTKKLKKKLLINWKNLVRVYQELYRATWLWSMISVLCNWYVYLLLYLLLNCIFSGHSSSYKSSVSNSRSHKIVCKEATWSIEN